METGRGRNGKATHRHLVLRSAAVAATAALVLAGCSSEDIAEKAAEEALEQQLEADGQNGDVDIELDEDGGVRIEGSDGEVVDINGDGEGNISIQGEGSDGDVEIDVNEEDGETVISTPEGEMVIGSGDLPDDFPSDIPMPDGLTVTSATSMASADGDMFIISGSIADDFGPATEAWTSALEAAGFEQQSMTESTDGTFFAFVSAEWNISGGLNPSSTGSGSDVGINVVPVTP